MDKLTIAETFAKLQYNLPKDEFIKFPDFLNSLSEENERKGRYMYWTFKDGSKLKAYGYRAEHMHYTIAN